MVGVETAVGEVERDLLPRVLLAVHGGGFGHLARVLDPSRGEFDLQLRTAGVRLPESFRPPGDDRVLITIEAGPRLECARQLLIQGGANDVVVMAAGETGLPALSENVATLPERRARPAVARLAD